MTKPSITIQRVYEPLPEGDVACFLVDRLWPRGMRKEKLAHATWAKEAAPSTALRQWYHAREHDPSQWDAFCERYLAELAGNRAAWEPIVEARETRPVVLLYGSHDTQRNHAMVLREFLKRKRPRA